MLWEAKYGGWWCNFKRQLPRPTRWSLASWIWLLEASCPPLLGSPGLSFPGEAERALPCHHMTPHTQKVGCYLKKKIQRITSVGKEVEELEPCALLMEMSNGAAAVEKRYGGSSKYKKLNYHTQEN